MRGKILCIVDRKFCCLNPGELIIFNSFVPHAWVYLGSDAEINDYSFSDRIDSIKLGFPLCIYVWIKVGNWPMWEHRLVEGPYIHHVSMVYGRFGEILLEACKYIPGLVPDVLEPSESELTGRFM